MENFDLIVERMKSGELPDPYQHDDEAYPLLKLVRITGMGYRTRRVTTKDGEIDIVYYRDPKRYLSADFISHCNALPCLALHPDAENPVRNNVGVVGNPFYHIAKNELWGVAKIYDHATKDMILKSGVDSGFGLSTSPLVFMYEVSLVGKEITIEDPRVIDHVALVPRGFWDRKHPDGLNYSAHADASMRISPSTTTDTTDTTKETPNQSTTETIEPHDEDVMDEKLLREMFDKFQREDAAKAAAHADAAPADESKKADEKPADVEKKEADKKDTAAPADESKKADEKPVDESKKADLGKADESTVQQKREDDEVAKLRAEIATLKASHEAMANPKLITDEDEVKISELLEDDQKLHNAFADQSMRPLTRGQFDTLQTLQSRAIVKWGAKADAFKDERIDVTSMSPMAVRAYWNTLKAAAHADAAVMEKPTNYLMWDASGKQTLNYVDWRTKIDQEKSRRINGIQSETNKV